MKPKFNEAEIRREIASKCKGIYELRILMTDFYSTKLSAYFDSDYPDEIIRQMMSRSYPKNCNVNFYLTSNPVKEYCRSREQFDNLIKCKIMTQDDDIERLTWLPIDIDPEHPAGTCATDEEKKNAWEQAEDVCHYMKAMGFDEPEIVDSGNGFHLKYRIDLPNNEEGRGVVEQLLDKLHESYPLVDVTSKNPSRILKLPGTLTMKGRHTEDRPFRWARIVQDAASTEEATNAEQ